jgi:hypothetical protein
MELIPPKVSYSFTSSCQMHNIGFDSVLILQFQTLREARLPTLRSVFTEEGDLQFPSSLNCSKLSLKSAGEWPGSHGWTTGDKSQESLFPTHPRQLTSETPATCVPPYNPSIPCSPTYSTHGITTPLYVEMSQGNENLQPHKCTIGII